MGKVVTEKCYKNVLQNGKMVTKLCYKNVLQKRGSQWVNLPSVAIDTCNVSARHV
jgi:hypothetical protein